MIDYIKNALRTKSPIYQPEGAHPIHPADLFRSALYLKFWGGLVKKAIFYGKEVGDKEHEAIKFWAPPAIGALDWTKVDPDVVHAVLGLFTESCELMEHLLHALEGKEVTTQNWIDELGDTMWYQALLLGHLGVDFSKVQEGNIAKLKARFADKFTVDEVNNRDVTKENTALASTL